MVRFSVYWESFSVVLHFFWVCFVFCGLLSYLSDATCIFLFQEIHDLFKDYEIKYCYVDRNKRTGKNLTSVCCMFQFCDEPSEEHHLTGMKSSTSLLLQSLIVP